MAAARQGSDHSHWAFFAIPASSIDEKREVRGRVNIKEKVFLKKTAYSLCINLPIGREEQLEERDNQLCTAAVRCESKQIMRVLSKIGRFKDIDLNAVRNSRNETLLMLAAFGDRDIPHAKSHEAVECLLRSGADPLASSTDGRTALMEAVSAGRFSVARMLIAHVPPEKRMGYINQKDNDDFDARHYAQQKGYTAEFNKMVDEAQRELVAVQAEKEHKAESKVETYCGFKPGFLLGKDKAKSHPIPRVLWEKMSVIEERLLSEIKCSAEKTLVEHKCYKVLQNQNGTFSIKGSSMISIDQEKSFIIASLRKLGWEKACQISLSQVGIDHYIEIVFSEQFSREMIATLTEQNCAPAQSASRFTP